MTAGGGRLFFGVWLLEGACVLMDNSASVCMETVLTDSAGYLYINIYINTWREVGMCLEGVLEELECEVADRYDQNILYTSTKFVRNKKFEIKTWNLKEKEYSSPLSKFTLTSLPTASFISNNKPKIEKAKGKNNGTAHSHSVIVYE